MMYALGLSLAGKEVRVALVSKQGKKIELEFLHTFILDEEEPDLSKLLEPIMKGNRVKIVSGLPAADVILRNLELPMSNRKKILSILPFQVETVIPFPTDEVVIHPVIQKKSRRKSQVFLAATKREKIDSHLATLRALFIDPEQVSTSLHALARFAEHLKTSSLNGESSSSPYTKIAYLSRSESFFLLLENARILIAKVFSSSASSFDKELKKADEFISSKYREAAGIPWLYAGDLSHDIALAGERAHPDSAFAIAIGLCLDALATDSMTIQWRQGNFLSPSLQKKQKMYALSASATFLLSALLLGPVGHILSEGYETNLLQRARACLERTTPNTKATRDLDAACRLLSKQMLELKKEEKIGSFSPKVSDLLAYLSSLSIEGSSLHSLKYEHDLEGRVKVMITWEASPQAARTLFEKISCEETMIDTKRKVVWNKDGDDYRAQFFLK